MAKKKIIVKGTAINLLTKDQEDYISLTDIANKFADDIAIYSWMRNKNTVEFLGAWEQLYNPRFKGNEFVTFSNQAGLNNFNLTPRKWITATNANGIVSKAGRGGGTYAHKDIAINFCYWLSPTFQLYLIKEFQRLKEEEALRLGDPFNIKRFLTAGNYSLLVSSMLSQVDERLLTHPQPYKKRLPFAAEADMINKIVFGLTAQEWRKRNADKPVNRNQRDYASVLDLQILANLESLDSMLLQWDCEKDEREKFLQEMYDFQYPILKRSKTIKKLQALSDKLDRK